MRNRRRGIPVERKPGHFGGAVGGRRTHADGVTRMSGYAINRCFGLRLPGFRLKILPLQTVSRGLRE